MEELEVGVVRVEDFQEHLRVLLPENARLELSIGNGLCLLDRISLVLVERVGMLHHNVQPDVLFYFS